MFADDVGLLPDHMFTRMLRHAQTAPAQFMPFADLVDTAARRHGVDPDLVHAVIAGESGYRASAQSRAGAQGLMQLMPGTQRDLGVSDAFDPRQNVDAAAGPGAQEEQAAREEPAEPAPPQFDDEAVVVGSRAQPRSVTVSTVPIDAIPAEDIVSQGDTDVADRLRTIVPSYNVDDRTTLGFLFNHTGTAVTRFDPPTRLQVSTPASAAWPGDPRTTAARGRVSPHGAR